MSNTTATTTAYQITDMTCGHCAQAVTSELSRLGGASTVTVTSQAPLPEQDVTEALGEAGDYRLASSLTRLSGVTADWAHLLAVEERSG
jgi:copper chaperone CopZ